MSEMLLVVATPMVVIRGVLTGVNGGDFFMAESQEILPVTASCAYIGTLYVWQSRVSFVA